MGLNELEIKLYANMHRNLRISKNKRALKAAIKHPPVMPEKNNHELVIVDVGLDTDNLGDQIIMHYAHKYLDRYFRGYDCYKMAVHGNATNEDVKHMLSAKATVFFGIPLFFNASMEEDSPYKFDKRLLYMDNALLVASAV